MRRDAMGRGGAAGARAAPVARCDDAMRDADGTIAPRTACFSDKDWVLTLGLGGTGGTPGGGPIVSGSYATGAASGTAGGKRGGAATGTAGGKPGG
eukprot:gene15862-18443_t